jgi:hypothetical protein
VLINKNNLKLLSFMRIFQFLVLTTNYMYHSKLQERRGLSLSAAPGFEPSCARLSPPRCLTYPLGLQDVQWAVRLVVVRASWPGHPRKKKKIKKEEVRICLLHNWTTSTSTTATLNWIFCRCCLKNLLFIILFIFF